MPIKNGGVVVNFSVNAANYSAGINKVIAANKQASKSVEELGHSTVSQMQASSAAIRALENPLGNNLRAVERFLTTIPGVGAALKVAFPLVGAVALGAVVAKTTMEVVKFVQHLNQVPAAVNEGAEAIRASMTATSDEIEVTIDRLENANAKLEKRPGDGLKLAIDEASVAMDTLSSKTLQTIKELNELFKTQSSSGFWAQLIGSQASTSSTENEAIQYQQRLADIHNAAISARFGANGDPAGIARAQSEEAAAARKAAVDIITSTTRQLDANKAKQSQNILNSGRFDASNADLNELRQLAQGHILAMDQSDRLQGAQQENAADLQKQEADARAKAADLQKQEADARAKAAAEKANAALRKAQEDRLKLLNDAHEQMDSVKLRSMQDEMDFWAAQAAATDNGSKVDLLAHREAFKKLTDLRQSVMRDTQKELQEFDTKAGTSALGQSDQDLSKNSDVLRNIEEQGKATVAWTRSAQESFSVQSESDNALADATIRANEASGAITKLGAAQQAAALHAKEFNEQMEILVNNRAGVQGTDSEKKAQQQQIDNQIAALQGAYKISSLDDNAAINSQTLSGSFRDTLQQFVQQSQDAAAQVREAFTNAFESINSTLSTVLTARYHTRRDFEHAISNGLSSDVRGVGSQLLNTGLQRVEGYGLSALGIGGAGKLGTRSNPMIVQDVNAALKGAGSSVVSAANSAGGAFSSIFKAAVGLLPAFAGGGPVSAGMTALVGEDGPEIVKFGDSGTVIPNNRLSAGGTSVHHHNYSVDLRNSPDPRENERRFQRALMAVHGSSIRSSVAASRERMLRRPRIAAA